MGGGYKKNKFKLAFLKKNSQRIRYFEFNERSVGGQVVARLVYVSKSNCQLSRVYYLKKFVELRYLMEEASSLLIKILTCNVT